MRVAPSKNRVVGFRTTQEFTDKFDILCAKLGHPRSEVARCVLKNFYNKASQSDFWFELTKKELY